MKTTAKAFLFSILLLFGCDEVGPHPEAYVLNHDKKACASALFDGTYFVDPVTKLCGITRYGHGTVVAECAPILKLEHFAHAAHCWEKTDAKEEEDKCIEAKRNPAPSQPSQ